MGGVSPGQNSLVFHRSFILSPGLEVESGENQVESGTRDEIVTKRSPMQDWEDAEFSPASTMQVEWRSQFCCGNNVVASFSVQSFRP